MPHIPKIKPQQGCGCGRAHGQPPLQVLAEAGQCMDSRSRLSWKHLATIGALPDGYTGVLLVDTGLGHWSTGAPRSPGTHQPAEHLWVLMMDRSGEPRGGHGNCEKRLVPAHPLSKISSWPWAVSVVMGIPSVKREVHSYLTDTLSSLISELTQQEKEDSVIVVLIAEVRRS